MKAIAFNNFMNILNIMEMIAKDDAQLWKMYNWAIGQNPDVECRDNMPTSASTCVESGGLDEDYWVLSPSFKVDTSRFDIRDKARQYQPKGLRRGTYDAWAKHNILRPKEEKRVKKETKFPSTYSFPSKKEVLACVRTLSLPEIMNLPEAVSFILNFLQDEYDLSSGVINLVESTVKEVRDKIIQDYLEYYCQELKELEARKRDLEEYIQYLKSC